MQWKAKLILEKYHYLNKSQVYFAWYKRLLKVVGKSSEQTIGVARTYSKIPCSGTKKIFQSAVCQRLHRDML